MDKILESEVSFGDSAGYGRYHYQDILARGKVIGCLVEIERGLLQPIETIHQVCVPDSKKDKCKRFIESEDVGYIIAMFEDFDEYLSFYNAEVLPERV